MHDRPNLSKVVYIIGRLTTSTACHVRCTSYIFPGLEKMSSGLSGLLGGYDSDDSDDPVSTSTDKHDTQIGEGETLENAISGSSESGGPIPPGGTPSNSDDESESGSEEEEEDSRDTRRHKRSISGIGVGGGAGPGLLPSVDDLFSSTAGPDFLKAPGVGQEFVVEAMQKKKAKSEHHPSSSTVVSAAKSNAEIDGNKRGRGTGVVQTDVGIKKPKGGSVGPVGPPVERKAAAGGAGKDGKGKMTAKERVKGQRLKGQSGIGSDFRVWKSDLEMTMRQEFD